MGPSKGEHPDTERKRVNMFEHKNGKKLAGKVLVLALCLAMLAGVFGGTTRAKSGSGGSLVLAAADSRQEMSAADIYEQNVNSTVGITTAVTTTNYWGYETQAAAAGSGFIVTDDGYILTNYHVVENAETITVALYDGTTYDGELVGYDESNDIAVLKVDAEDLIPVTVGDSAGLRVGDEVVAIGNPLGELTFSLTGGMISALDREITVSGGVTMDLIQTDCAINAGNSGGALFNMYGEVIGITNAKYSSSGMGASIDNIGFAIPISRVAGIVQSIIENGYIAKPYIGVTISDVSAEAKGYGLPEGAAVKSVEEDGPAAKAGLQENDIITAVDGQAVTGRRDLSDIVGAAQVGSDITLTVYRQGEEMDVTVTVGEKTQDALPTPTPEPEQEPAQESGGSRGDWDDFGNSLEDFLRQFGQEHIG